MSASLPPARNEEEALLALVDPMLKSLATKRRPWQMEWEDAYQEARVAAILAIRGFDGEAGTKLSTWVYTRVSSRFRDLSRGFKRREAHEVAVADPGAVLEARGEVMLDAAGRTLSMALACAVMEALPPPPNAALALRLIAREESVQSASVSLGYGKSALWESYRKWLKAVKRAAPELFGLAPPASAALCKRGHAGYRGRDGSCAICRSLSHRKSYAKRRG